MSYGLARPTYGLARPTYGLARPTYGRPMAGPAVGPGPRNQRARVVRDDAAGAGVVVRRGGRFEPAGRA